MLERLKAGRHLARAEKQYARGNLSAARAEFDNALRFNPDNSAVHLLYAVFLADTNDLVSAVSHAGRAVEIRPKSAPYRLFLGRIHLDYGRYEEAAEQFSLAQELNTKSQLARDYVALADILRGNIEAGLKELAAAGLSQNTGFHARALVALERLVRVQHSLTQSKHLDVKEEQAPSGGLFRGWRARRLLSSGLIHLDLCEWESAARKFRGALALSSELLEARFQEGVAFFMAEDYEQAEKIMHELVDEGDEPLLYLGGALVEQGKYDEAVKVLEKISRTAPEYHYYLGLYLMAKDQDREAMRHFEMAAGKRHDLLQRAFDRACEIYGVDVDVK